jgi:hypothetical protein
MSLRLSRTSAYRYWLSTYTHLFKCTCADNRHKRIQGNTRFPDVLEGHELPLRSPVRTVCQVLLQQYSLIHFGYRNAKRPESGPVNYCGTCLHSSRLAPGMYWDLASQMRFCRTSILAVWNQIRVRALPLKRVSLMLPDLKSYSCRSLLSPPPSPHSNDYLNGHHYYE